MPEQTSAGGQAHAVCQTCGGLPALGGRGTTLACHPCGYRVSAASYAEALQLWDAKNAQPDHTQGVSDGAAA